MIEIELHNNDAGFEPAPRFASDADIELAEQLRYRLEQRYFGPSGKPSPAQPVWRKGH
jgi:hypothetical protein